MPAIQFGVKSYKSQSLQFSAQRCINGYAEAAPADAKSSVVVYGAPGISSWSVAGSGPIRGARAVQGVLYVVTNTELRSVDSAGTASSSIGTIPGTGRVYMTDNGSELCVVVSGTAAYTYDLSSTFAEITDGDFLTPGTVTFQDGYLIFSEDGSDRWFISDLNDATAYDSTNRANAEGRPDDLVRVYSDHRELWLFGTETTEIWYNTGATFPFERSTSTFIERGCAAAQSVASDDNTIFWLGNDRIVYRANGFTPQRVSDYAIEQHLREASSVSDAYGFFYTWNGHKWYHLTVPQIPATFVYDLSTGLWHERTSLGLDYWRIGGVVEVYGKVLAWDSTSARIGEISGTTYTEFSDSISLEVVSPPQTPDQIADGKRLFCARFELAVEAGVGLNSGQGSDPQVELDWSDDGGHTWSLRKPWRSMGKLGQYKKRLKWRRMGSFYNRVWRVRITDPVFRAIIAAYADYSLGDH